MAKIETRVCSNGDISYRVLIRIKGHEISRTFYTEQDAKLFAFYRERLINNMDNFDVPTDQLITLESIFELKIKSLKSDDKRTVDHFNSALSRFKEIFKDKIFYHEISYDDWVEAAKILSTSFVYMGGTKFGKKESAKRNMSPKTLRNIFAYASSAVSYFSTFGKPLENNPQKVINTFIKKIKNP